MGFRVVACRKSALALLAGALAITALAGSGANAEGDPTPPRKAAGKVLASGLDIPWGLDFLPSGAALVTERGSGKVYLIPKEGGRKRVVAEIPGVDPNAGEGGLLGLALSPRYRKDGLVYAYLTTDQDNRIVRFKLPRGSSKQPRGLTPLLTGIDRSSIHNGGRIAFGPDGLLYAGVGDAANPDVAQDRDALNGKILRINPKGGVPKANPFAGSPVYSFGHRNVQGLAWDKNGRLWASELGQNDKDEVNLIRAGNNYGWPLVEGKGDTEGGKFTNPQVTWSPAVSSPSGAAIRGKTLFVAALRGERLWKIPLKGNKAGEPKGTLQGSYGRLRTVEVAPDGSLWIATANGGDDRIVKLGR